MVMTKHTMQECPKADDEEALDKYLNMELRMGAGTDDERWGRVIKRAKVLVVNLLVMLMLTLSLIRDNTKSNLLMGLLNDMPQTLLPKTCMHRSTMKVICFNCWMKSWIIRRMIQ
jgi:hypothetical protein